MGDLKELDIRKAKLLGLLKKRFFVDRMTGEPVSWAAGQSSEMIPHTHLKRYICISATLKHDINFYLVLRRSGGIVIVMSDGERTTYLWLGGPQETLPKMQATYPVYCKSLLAAAANFIRMSQSVQYRNQTATQWLAIKLKQMGSFQVLHNYSR